jgi:SAM-dependent methyltransferase
VREVETLPSAPPALGGVTVRGASYPPAMDVQPVRDAYSTRSAEYIGLVDGGGWHDHEEDTALVRRHLTGLSGPVLDLGCGPGHWTGHLHSLGVEVTGVDLVPEFVAHARAAHPGPDFRLGSMTDLDVADHSVAGVLSWYSTVHVPPRELAGVLTGFRRLLHPSGVLVVGFFDSDGDVAAFDHAVVTAYRWPADTFARHLAEAGFTEVERHQHQLPDRPDRRYATIAARAS